MALTIDEIREAAMIGKSFTLTDVKLIDMSYDNGKLSLGWEMPQMQNKHYCPGMVVDYISICEKPKYDPCRLFRKGDIVRLKEWNGRCPALPEDWKFDNGLFKVHEDEKFNSSVEITRENSKTVYIAPICFLELVTSVEELEPYSVVDAHTHWDVADKDMKTVATYCKGIHPNAKAAAEAERDRLNEEHRKEQK